MAKSSDASGTARVMTGEEFLKSVDGANLASPVSGTTANTQEEAFELAKMGELRRWHPRPYTPSADVVSLSEIVQIREKIDRMEKMLRFLIQRS